MTTVIYNWVGYRPHIHNNEKHRKYYYFFFSNAIPTIYPSDSTILWSNEIYRVLYFVLYEFGYTYSHQTIYTLTSCAGVTAGTTRAVPDCSTNHTSADRTVVNSYSQPR